MKTKFKEILTSFNEAPTGGFVGITDYQSQNGDIVSVTGRLGLSYGDAKQAGIDALEQAIKTKDFEAVTVSGSCYEENGVFNSRKRSWDMKEFEITFEVDEVMETAKEILEAWKNPKARKDNKVQLTEKENGLSLNKETGSFNFSLMVDHETYKGNDSDKEKKVKATMPESLLKTAIRKRFEKKIKAYTIEEGKFARLKIGGKEYLSENITF